MRAPVAVGLVALALTGAAPGLGDDSLVSRVDAYLEPLVAAHELSGVVRIARGETVLVERTVGKANWELGAPMTGDARFRIASITKTFTGAALVMLVERGQLSLRDPLSKYLPTFPRGDTIEIRHLLLHASGAGDPDSLPCSDATLDDLVGEVSKKPLSFSPGTSSRYSNGGYVLLARVIEKVSGRPWEQFLHDEIVRPLALASTGRDDAESLLPMRVAGYVPGPGPTGLSNAPCVTAQAAIGSGALVSTAADLHHWGHAVRNETLFKRAGLEHPYGWGVRKYWGRDVIEQSGILDGAASYLADYLYDDVTIVILSNVQSGILTDIGKDLGAIVFGLERKAPKPWPKAIESTVDSRHRWLGRYRHPEIGTFLLTERGGNLSQRWEGARSSSHVRVTGSSSAFNPQESGSLELVRDGKGATTGIRVSWGDGEAHEFQKQDGSPPPREGVTPKH